MVGARTGKDLYIVVQGKSCSKCQTAQRLEREVCYHECPSNYEGSSKGLECVVARQMAENVWGDGNVLEVIIADDDSTMRSHAQHSWQEKLKAGRISEAQIPHYAGGSKKPDHGKRCLDIDEPKFLADPQHRTKTYAGRYYKLLENKTKKSEITGIDCARMKRNFGYFLKMFRKEPDFDVFKERAKGSP